jgi:hypothetical protein
MRYVSLISPKAVLREQAWIMHSMSLINSVNHAPLVIIVGLVFHLLVVAGALAQLRLPRITSFCGILIVTYRLMRINNSIANTNTLHSLHIKQIFVGSRVKFLVDGRFIVDFSVGNIAISLDTFGDTPHVARCSQ